MKNRNWTFPLVLAAVAWCGIVCLVVLDRQARRKELETAARTVGRAEQARAGQASSRVDPLVAALQEAQAAEQGPVVSNSSPPPRHPEITGGTGGKGAAVAEPAVQNPGLSQEAPAQDPLARAALSLVGADPAAEAYWYAAINDPTLSAQERQNLIEELNQAGLSDPQNPGAEDLSLIANRLRLIEDLAPYAMDKVNADAFAEAYRDLVGLLNGQPPR